MLDAKKNVIDFPIAMYKRNDESNESVALLIKATFIFFFFSSTIEFTRCHERTLMVNVRRSERDRKKERSNDK